MTSPFDEQYRAQLIDPTMWIRRAEELLWVAEQLEPAITETVELAPNRSEKRFRLAQGLGPYFMVVSFAIENLLKSVLVQNNLEKFEQVVRANQQLPQDLNGHDLVRLAEKVQFPSTAQTRNVLERLSRNATWAGRYPVPSKAKSLASAEDENREEVSLSVFGGRDYGKIRTLIEQVKGFVNDRKAAHGSPTGA